MSSTEFQFECPTCSQPFTARYEHIGMEMECPECGGVFVIPNLLAMQSISAMGSSHDVVAAVSEDMSEDELQQIQLLNMSFFESITDEEQTLLNREKSDIMTRVKGLKNRHCWEFGVVGAMLDTRLQPLRKCVFETNYEQQIQKGWKKSKSKFKTFLREHSHLYFSLLHEWYEIFAVDYPHALQEQKLFTILRLFEKVEAQIEVLTQFHERIFLEPLPAEDEYVRIQQIMTGWVPHNCQCLETLVQGLAMSCGKMRDSLVLPPQISLIPPSIYNFVRIASALNIGFEAPKTVNLDVSRI